MSFDKELLFKAQLPEADVEVPGIGTMRVRGLSRAEVLRLQSVNDVMAVERKTLAMAIVDPVLTEAEVGRWQKASAAMGAIEVVSEKVRELSGLNRNPATVGKEAWKEFESDSDLEFRVLPSDEAE